MFRQFHGLSTFNPTQGLGVHGMQIPTTTYNVPIPRFYSLFDRPEFSIGTFFKDEYGRTLQDNHPETMGMWPTLGGLLTDAYVQSEIDRLS